MPVPETILLRVIDTGPCDNRELVMCAPSLINEVGQGENIRPSQVQGLVDQLEGQGLVGRTGSRRDTLVISQLGYKTLQLN